MSVPKPIALQCHGASSLLRKVPCALEWLQRDTEAPQAGMKSLGDWAQSSPFKCTSGVVQVVNWRSIPTTADLSCQYHVATDLSLGGNFLRRGFHQPVVAWRVYVRPISHLLVFKAMAAGIMGGFWYKQRPSRKCSAARPCGNRPRDDKVRQWPLGMLKFSWLVGLESKGVLSRGRRRKTSRKGEPASECLRPSIVCLISPYHETALFTLPSVKNHPYIHLK